MASANSTTNKTIGLFGLFCFCSFSVVKAQNENSPYSRYGLGDVVPSQNIFNRGMGGLSAAYYDFSTINFRNPASYARLQATSLDIGVELDNRSLRSLDPPRKFSSYSPQISYVQLGFPLKKNGTWGMTLGLRPVARVSYKVERFEKPAGLDSIRTLHEGTGGAYEVHLGTGLMIAKNLSVGININFLFGSKDINNRQMPLSDSVFYYSANFESKTTYKGLILDGGIQYTLPLNKTTFLRFGGYGRVQQKLSASRDTRRETFQYNSAGGTDSIDVIFKEEGVSGKITYPASYTGGVILDKPGKWMLGVDFNTEMWSQYRYYGEKDAVDNSWTLNMGGQLYPHGGRSYWNNVAYRAGVLVGKDYISDYLRGKDLSKWGASIGIGLPMRRPSYTNQFSVINMALEFGQRGNKTNTIRETYFRFAVGLSLSDLWFQKRKYD